MPEKRMLILITNSFAALNVVHSGLLRQLCRKYNIYLMSDLIGKEDISNFCKTYFLKAAIDPCEFPDENSLLRILRRLEKLLFLVYNDIETFQVKYGSYLLTKPVFRFARLLRHNTWLAAVLVILRKLIIWYALYIDAGKLRWACKYDLVISTSPLDSRENRVVNFLKTKKVKSVALVISWDNLSTKGVMNAEHDNIFVWNHIMAAEYRRFYKLFDGRTIIRITGIPRFDLHKSKQFAAHDFQVKYRQQLGVANERILLFATSPGRHVPDQQHYLQDLLDYAETKTDIIVLLRCHPADYFDYSGSYKKDPNLRIWGNYNSEAIDHPFGKWLPAADFLYNLSAMLHSCAVCLHIASTLRLDAAACHKPVINIAYDPTFQPYHSSIRRYYDYTHQLPLNKSNIGTTVYSKTELYHALDTMLTGTEQTDPDAVRPFVAGGKGNAVERTLYYISQCMH
ncbi:hypothetical protein [Dyadobacter sandarakinus]|uniref:CDP-Glycerol:Poly(Glycerophosphate) glycerophosphotransferase n=1 Tax=Dyadobacter sandarakinus TaxID=2747268 RepID=A0ABX7IBE7_9BACT|nr:hypothetical protein [Dyadobacter sandarakinus]QRR03240.1 hypothetical protein HWI92_21140 [Dyadobacter sandarakinus]